MGTPSDVYLTVIIFRFILGVGLGGVYPLSATKAAEDAGDGHGHVDTRAASLSFFWQNPGALTPWLLGYLITFRHISSDIFWRLILGLGFIPGLVVVIGSIIERNEKKKAQQLTYSQAAVAVEKPTIDVKKLLTDTRIIKKLIATGGGWFIYDVAYYGVSLFGGAIVREISTSSYDNVSSNDSIRDTAGKQLIALSMAIPACLLTIYLLKFISTKMMQVYGFIFIAIMFALMAVFFETLKGVPLFVIYCLLLFSLSFGPNVTTFILPAETYPQNIRATFNGISAACGKLGAVVGAYMFGPLAKVTSYVFVMGFCCALSVIGAIFSYYLINDNRNNVVATSSERAPLRGNDDDDDNSLDQVYNVIS
jgi:PHS family inorganic phosphate transporter-like MFS transporter